MPGSYSITAILQAQVEGFVNGFRRASNTIDTFVNDNKKTFDSFKKVGAAATAGGLAIAAGLGASIKVASDFQSAFAGVRKTVDASEAEFKVLEDGIRNMAKSLPASAGSIAEVAEAAGQLGIKKENILAFSRTMIDLGEATNLTADEAATSFAQFANVVGMPQENFSRLGSSVVALGNSMATTEADIVSMAMRLSGTGAQVGLTEAQIMALSATMSSVGINAEAGGSAMSTVMKKISNAVADGGKKMDGFAKVANMSSKEFSETWKNDPITALDMFIKGLSESGESGENLNAILKDLGIKGIQETDTLLRLAGASGLLSGAVDTSTKAWEENTALSKEAAQRYETFESKIAMLKNTITDVAISIGNVLLPAVTTMVEFVQKLVEKFGNLDEKTMTIIAVVATLAAGFLLLVGPILMIIGFIPSILAGLTALGTVGTTIMSVLAGTATATTGAGAAFVAIAGPIAWAAAAIVGLVTAGVLLYKNWDVVKEKLSAVMPIFEVMKGALLGVSDSLKALVPVLQSKLSPALEALKRLFESLKPILGAVAVLFSSLLVIAFGAFISIISGVIAAIGPLIDAVINIVDIVSGMVNVVVALLTGDFAGAWNQLESIGKNVQELFSNILKAVVAFVSTFVSTVVDYFKDMYVAIGGASIFPKGFLDFLSGIKNAWTATIEWFKNSWSTITTFFSDLWNSIKEVFTSAWEGIKTSWNDSVTELKETWASITEFFSNLWSGIVTTATSIWDTVVAKWNEVVAFVTTIFGPMIDFFSNTWTTILGTATSIWDNLTAFLSTLWTNIQTIASSAWEIIKNVILGPILLLINLVTGDMQEFKSNLSAIWTNISDAAGRIWGSLKEIVISYIKMLIDNSVAIFTGYISVVAGYWTAIKDTAANIWAAIVETVVSLIESLKVKIESVMQSIKDVIDTAWNFIESLWLSIIRSIVTATGVDFDAMRDSVMMAMDAIKQTIDTIWNYIRETFQNVLSFLKALVTGDFEGMKQAIKSQMDLIKETINYIWNDIKEVFNRALEAIKIYISTKFEDMKNTAKQKTTQTKNDISNTWESIKTYFSTVLTNIVNTVKTKFTEFVNGVKSKMTDAKNRVVDGWKEAQKFLSEIDLAQIGKDIIQGLINGIKGKIEDVKNAITDVTSAITGKIKSILDIHSPSRVMREYGEFTGQGLADGVASTEALNAKVIEDLGKVIIAATQKNAEEVTKIADVAEKKRTAIQKEAAGKASKTASSSEQAIYRIIAKAEEQKRNLTATESQRITELRKKAASTDEGVVSASTKKLMAINDKAWADMVKKEEKLSKERLDAIKLFVADKKSTEELSLAAEAAIWEKSIGLFAEGTKERVAAQASYKKAMEVMDKERLESIKQFIADKKSLEQLSTVDEVAIWKDAVDSFKAGTKEKITSQIEYGKALDKVNSEITSVNKKYADEMHKINAEFKKQEEDLTKKYKDTLESRMKALYSFAGTFDEFDVKVSKSGAELLKNLGTQVDGFKKWQFEIERLAKRAIDEGLIGELTAMGPKALGELMALNELTDEQLSKYSALYQEKSELARTQSEAELIGMKEDTAVQINGMREVANTELSTLQSDWEKEIKGITSVTSTELSSLQQIGVDSVRGLLNGLNSMHSELQATARAIAESVSGTIKSALEIHSPSRVMHQLGVWTLDGFINGMKEKESVPASIIDEIGKSVMQQTAYLHDDMVAMETDVAIRMESAARHKADIISSIERSAVSERIKIAKQFAGDSLSEDQRYRDAMEKAEKEFGEELREIEWDFANDRIADREGYSKMHTEMEARHNQGRLDIIESFTSESLSKNESYTQTLKELNEKSANEILETEKSMGERLEQLVGQTLADIESTRELIGRRTLQTTKSVLDKNRELNKISAVEEMRIWKELADSFDENSDNRILAVEELAIAHGRAIENIGARNEELRAQEATITAEYTKAVEDRAKSIASFAGIFDEFKVNQEKSGEDLMANLKSQVDGFKSWQESIAELSSRAIDDGLMAELKALGPKAAGELAALNAMTDTQLEEYSKLYQEKQALARVQAEKELIGMKGDTEKRIEDLRAVVQSELDEINAVWKESSELIVSETDRELSKLRDVGQQAGQGLLDGLASMEGALVSKATSIANAVKDAMAGALDIHSPSRWMRDMIGKNMMIGWIDGMEAMRSSVIAVAVNATDWMTPEMPGLKGVNVPSFPQRSYGSKANRGQSSSGASGGDLIQHITINSPEPLSASEYARKTKQTSRDLLTEWRG